jgi:predicted amidophosphoribosyltransferase
VPSIVLEKTRQTDPQKKFRSKHCKQRNVRGAFRLPQGRSAPHRVLMVDDVWDSGVSLNEAARILRTSDGERPTIHLLTMARTRHTDDS